MSQEKYIGMDVHQATISVAVMDAGGKLIMECILETRAATILESIQGLHGTLSLTFEEGTSAAWLHDLLKPHVNRLVVCDPRKAALLKEGNKSDRLDARKLAELLRTNQLKPVYHGDHGVRTLKELGRSYLTLTKDVTRGMNRIKALYRSWAIPCSGTSVYAPRHRAEWLAKIVEPGVRVRAQTALSATGSVATRASGSATRTPAGEPQAPCGEVTSPDSCYRPDSGRLAGGIAADTPPFPYQTAALGLQRFRG
jgi:transposase